MIYEMALDLRDMLHAKRFPVDVRYGPDRAPKKNERASAVITIERDTESNDVYGPAQGPRQNPRIRGVRVLAARAKIYAKSSLPGAHIGDHERFCEQLADALLVAIYEWGAQAKTGGIQIASARYIREEHRADIEVWPGVVYEILFGVPRGVADLTWPAAGEKQARGDARPTAGAPGFRNRTDATLAHAPEGTTPAVGCGGSAEPDEEP
jgi:hypothetical protein